MSKRDPRIERITEAQKLWQQGQPRRCETNQVGAMGECLACDAEQGVYCLKPFEVRPMTDSSPTQVESREPFRPDDPFDAMAESFRLQVVDMILDAGKIAIFHDLPHHRKLEAFMAGTLTAFFGVSMAFVAKEQWKEFCAEVVRYLPQAIENAEQIAADGESRVE